MATKKQLCPDSKVCTQCLVEKPLEDFYEGRGKLNRRAACKSCCNKRGRAYWARERERFKGYRESRAGETSTYLRKYNLLRKYQMSVEQYDRMLDEQDGVCAICCAPPAEGRRLAVDHDHGCCPGRETCGSCVRGLLCGGCNKRLGVLEDHPWRTKAEEYLAR